MTCPNCIETMKQLKKPFGPCGAKRIFMQCPKCGYNIQKSSIPFYQKRELTEFEKRIEEINNKWEML